MYRVNRDDDGAAMLATQTDGNDDDDETFLYTAQDCNGLCQRPFDFLMKFRGIIINYNKFVCDIQIPKHSSHISSV